MSHDVIDLLADIRAGSALDAIRRARPDAREHAQQSFLALLEPAVDGDFALRDRYAVAAYVALLHDESAERSRSSQFYLDLLQDEAEAPFVAAVAEAADRGRRSGPYGVYREPALEAESVSGPSPEVSSHEIPRRLQAALEHAHLLVLHPRDARGQSLRALADAGWTADSIVTLSQLVAFLTFQLRLVHGLGVLAAAGAPTTAREEVNA